MNIDKFLPNGGSRWLTPADIKSPTLATIEKVTEEPIKENNGIRNKPAVHFSEKLKPLLLNVPNIRTMRALYGNDTDSWSGKQIVLYKTDVSFLNTVKEGIRIRAPNEQGTDRASEPNPEEPPPDKDDVPF